MANMIHGTARAMCSGRETRFGTSPEKISQRWKAMEAAPSASQTGFGHSAACSSIFAAPDWFSATHQAP
jgi:hypothetical protein